MGTSVFAFVVVLGVLVFFHELGHFLVARFFGVGVDIFSLGFGPRLIGRRIGRTDYRISAIPLGGFVKMVGEDPDSDLPEADIPLSFTHKPVSRRMAIVAAGPLFNIVLAVLIFFCIFWVSGTYIREPVFGTIQADSPAAAAGFQKGDRVLTIDGAEIRSWEEMSGRITGSQGRALTLTLKRGETVLNATVTPKTMALNNFFGEATDRWVIGVTDAGEFTQKPLGPAGAFQESLIRSYEITKLTVLSVVKLFEGTISTKTLGGPIMIAQMAGEQAREGAGNLLFFIGLLSINLAVLNFLPIPVLDGGHLLFFLIEALRGRPVDTRVREAAQKAGVFVLLLLMVFVFYNDISRIFSAS